MSALGHVDEIDRALKEATAIVTLIRRAPDVEHRHIAWATGVAEDRLQDAQTRLAALWAQLRTRAMTR